MVNQRSLNELALFAGAGGGGFLEATCLDGEQSVLLSGSHIQQAYCAPDKMTSFSRLSRFGMTFKPLTADRGEALLMSYLAGFPAKTFQPPAVARASQESAAPCGSTWQGLLAKFDPVSSSWKTAQCSLLEDLEQSLETWPRWGSMRNGACYQRRESVRPTSESVFGFSLPTPVASDATSGAVIGKNDTYYTTSTGMPRKVYQKGTDGSVGLGRLVQMWPTPTVHGNNNRKGLSAKSGDGLATAVKLWTTPSESDAKRGGRITENMTGTSLAQQVNTPKYWPTPCATDHKGAGKSWALRDRLDYAVERGATKSNLYPTPTARNAPDCDAERRRNTPSLASVANMTEGTHGGQLNPTWVEWLMGWPLGWTELKPLVTGRFRFAQQPHLTCFTKDSAEIAND